MTDTEPQPLPEHELEPDRRQAYRSGRRNARNIYRVNRASNTHLSDEHIGCMFTEAAGLLAVHAFNAVYGIEEPRP